MKNKIIWILLYVVIAVWIYLSCDAMYNDYTTRVSDRLDSIEKGIYRQAENDAEFLEDSFYYKDSLKEILENQRYLISECQVTKEYIKDLKENWISIYQ